MPKVSVIIPTYGEPDRLKKAVESVLNQTYKDIEVIVVDDNNPDTAARKATETIMNGLMMNNCCVKYICHEYNKNGSAARNTGLKAAEGEFVSFLDSDDEYTSTRIAQCVMALEKNRDPKIHGVYTGCEYRKNDSTYRIMRDAKSGNFMKEYFRLTFNLYTGSNIFITKEAADTIGGFDESFVRHQDMEFMIRYFMRYDIIGIPDALVIKNFDGKNKPSAKKTEEIKKHFFETFKDTIDSMDKRDRERIYAAHFRQLAEQYVLERNYKKGLYYYGKVCRNHHMTPKYVMRAGVYLARSLKKA